MLRITLRTAFLPLLCAFAITGCGGDSSDNNRPSQIKGNIRSADTSVIDVDDNITALLSSTCNRQTFLYQAAVLPAGSGRFDPSDWSLVFQAEPDISGTLTVGQDAPTLRLHSDYVARATEANGQCSITETKSKTYRAIDGTIEFNGHGDAKFDLLFREDGPSNAPDVPVTGCWLVSRDGQQCQNATPDL